MKTAKRLAYLVVDVAGVLGVSEPTVRGMIARGEIPSRRIGRRILVLAEELESYLKSLHRAGEDVDDPSIRE